MLESLYLKAIEKKEEISDFFEKQTKNIDETKVKNEYNRYDFNKKTQDKNFSAIDGSFNKIKYMAGYLYAINSQTIVSKSGQSIIKESSATDIKTLSTIYNQRVEKVMSLEMNIYELKSTLNTLRKHDDIDYMLMDGSIRGSLMSFRPIYNIPPEIMRKFSLIYQEIEGSVRDNTDIGIEVETKKGFISSIINKVIKQNNLDFKYEDRKMDILLYFKNVEQLYCIYYLLKEFSEKIVCVSKTSSTKALFNEEIPDTAVIEYICDKSGYTHARDEKPNRIIREIENEKRTFSYPIKNRELTENAFTTAFVKLEDKSNVLKIEVPRKIDDKELISILDDLESISVDGYPHILKKAHDEVKIKNKDLKRIAKNMGLINTKTGRDFLN